MKPGATDHPKMARLSGLLELPIYSATGIVERLFHYTDRYTPRGDALRFGSAPLCAAIGWDRDTPNGRGVLIEALREAGWLDAHTVHGHVVHDWPDHCPDYRKRRIKASGEGWAVDDPIGRDSGKVREQAQNIPDKSGLPILSDPIQSEPIQPLPAPESRRKKPLVSRPEDWPTEEEKKKLEKWWKGKGGTPSELGRALERFLIQADAKAYSYAGRRGWTQAFRGAVLDGWALAEGARHIVAGQKRAPREPLTPGFDHEAAQAEVEQEWRLHAKHREPEPGCGLCASKARRSKALERDEAAAIDPSGSEQTPRQPSDP